MTRHYKVLLEWDADSEVWVTYVPALDHLSTFGETRAEALENTREAILGYLEAADKEGISVPTAGSEVELIDLEVAIA
jgi:antitoxin HicB